MGAMRTLSQNGSENFVYLRGKVYARAAVAGKPPHQAQMGTERNHQRWSIPSAMSLWRCPATPDPGTGRWTGRRGRTTPLDSASSPWTPGAVASTASRRRTTSPTVTPTGQESTSHAAAVTAIRCHASMAQVGPRWHSQPGSVTAVGKGLRCIVPVPETGYIGSSRGAPRTCSRPLGRDVTPLWAEWLAARSA